MICDDLVLRIRTSTDYGAYSITNPLPQPASAPTT